MTKEGWKSSEEKDSDASQVIIMATDPLRYVWTDKEGHPYILPQPITQHFSTTENKVRTQFQ